MVGQLLFIAGTLGLTLFVVWRAKPRYRADGSLDFPGICGKALTLSDGESYTCKRGVHLPDEHTHWDVGLNGEPLATWSDDQNTFVFRGVRYRAERD